jgi:DNA-binding CsgD family transcriptional regulator
VASESDRTHVRLAELVAALSLGVDLGFGQPMEHVLRQCLIALRVAERVGLDEHARAVVYYTALLVNVGCHSDAHEQAKWFGDDIALKSSIWDKRGPLGSGEWERVRIHPYLTERMLHQSQALAPLGRIAVQHRERLDGSGYPRGLAGAAISRAARILGAADAYQAMREPRPHRPARSADEAAAELRAEVKASRLDADAVEAVLGAAGHRVSRRRVGPAGLTAREVEVLRLLAQGLSNKEIARRLVISPKTVANHVEHIYAKIDASTRARASLFAMQHGLLPEEELVSRARVAQPGA